MKIITQAEVEAMAAQQTGTPTNTGMTAGQGTDLYGTLTSNIPNNNYDIYNLCREYYSAYPCTLIK